MWLLLGAFDGTGETLASAYTMPTLSPIMPLWQISSVPSHHWNSRRGMSATIEQSASLTPSNWRSRYESPPLTEQELRDIHIGIEEIRSGKVKHFTSLGETLEWLHRKRTK